MSCVKCNHADGVDANGWCLHGRPYVANQPDSNQRALCSCKCELDTTSATRVKSARLALNLSQRQLALALGLRRKQTVSDWECGKREPAAYVWLALAQLTAQADQRILPIYKKRMTVAQMAPLFGLPRE